MARSIGTNFNTQINSNSVRPFYALSVEFTSSTLRLWTGFGDLTIDSETYIGSGNLLTISNVQETADIKATGIKVSLSGLDTSILSSSISQDSEGANVELYFGVLTTTGNAQAIVDTPYKLFSGSLDTIGVSESGGTSTITITVENRLITLEKAADRRYTDQDQKNLFAGDRGLEFIDSLQNKELIWGGGSADKS